MRSIKSPSFYSRQGYYGGHALYIFIFGHLDPRQRRACHAKRRRRLLRDQRAHFESPRDHFHSYDLSSSQMIIIGVMKFLWLVGGARSGAFRYALPSSPGEYEWRFLSDGCRKILFVSETVVWKGYRNNEQSGGEPSPYSPTLVHVFLLLFSRPGCFVAEDRLMVEVSGSLVSISYMIKSRPKSSWDWVGLYPLDAPPKKYLTSKYVGSSSCAVVRRDCAYTAIANLLAMKFHINFRFSKNPSSMAS